MQCHIKTEEGYLREYVRYGPGYWLMLSEKELSKSVVGGPAYAVEALEKSYQEFTQGHNPCR